MSEYVVDAETLHHHPAIKVSHYYWYQPTYEHHIRLWKCDSGQDPGFYKMGEKILFCLKCRLQYCARCKMQHLEDVTCA